MKHFKQYLASTIATLGIFSLGIVLGWTSPALPDMEKTELFRNISSSQKSWIGSIASLGAMVGCPIAGVLVEVIGRKNTMFSFAIPFFAGWILIGFSKNYLMVLSGRFITGLSGGGFSCSVPIYIGEISSKSIRGLLLSGFGLMMVLGVLFSYVFGIFLSWDKLALVSSLPLILIIVLGIPFMPESPRFLLKKGNKVEEARKVYKFLQHDANEIEEEIRIIQKSIVDNVTEQKGQGINLKQIFQKSNMRPIFICLMLVTLEQLSAFNAIIFYTVDIFRSAGISESMSGISTIIFGIIQVFATLACLFLVDRAGRRILLLCSQAGMAFSLGALGLYFLIDKMNDTFAVNYLRAWLPLVSLCSFIIFFSIGIGPLSWTIIGEILPPNIKGAFTAVASSLVWLLAFGITKEFDHMIVSLGMFTSYWIFSGICLVGTLYIYFCVPETRGKSLDEIQKLFEK